MRVEGSELRIWSQKAFRVNLTEFEGGEVEVGFDELPV